MKFVEEFRFWKKKNLKEKLSLGLHNFNNILRYKGDLFIQKGILQI